MYTSSAPGPARRGGNPPVNVPPQQIRGAPNPGNMPQMANASGASNRISDMLDQVKAEYEAAIQQLNIAKMEQLEMERKIQSQVVEMDQIQQTLKTLEANHRRIRQQYEEDLMRMRRQLEGGQPGNVKLSNKRHRTPTNAGQQEDSLMSVVAAAAASSRAGGPLRPNSPVRVAPVPGAPRPLQQLAQPPQSQQSQPPQGLPGPIVPPPINSSESGSTTPTGRRSGPIPSINRDQPMPDANGKGEGRNALSSGNAPQSSASSPVSKKSKVNGSSEGTTSASNGKSSSSTSGSSSGGATSSSKADDASPTSASQNSSQQATTPTNSGATSTSKSSSSGTSASGSSTSAGPVSAQKSSKASKLNWNCVYTSKSSVSYQETERPAAEMHQSMDHQSVVCCVRFSSDGTMMASGCHKTAQVFDVKTGDRKFMVSRPGSAGSSGSSGASSANAEGEDAYVRAVCFSPDCTKLVAGMPQNTIRIWDIATNEEGPSLAGHESEIYSLDYVNDLIVSGSGDRKVKLWDARNGQCKKTFGSESGGPSDGVTSVALSPDGRLLAAASLDKVVRIWDTETSQLLDRLEGHSDSVYSIAFSPDGKNVISGSLDRNIMLWDVGARGGVTTRPRMLFQGHKDFVLSVAYTPDGRWLMSGSKDRSVVFWDPRSSRSVLTLTGYRNSVISVASSPASPYFATGSGDCFAVIWKYQCQTF